MQKLLFFIMNIIFLSVIFNNPLAVEAKVYINEVFPAPSMTSLGSEWVELYNDENKEIDITGFTLKDNSNNSLTFENTTIPPLGFVIATSNNVLNNSGDSVILRDASNAIIDSVTYPTIGSNNAYVHCIHQQEPWIISSNPTREITNVTSCTPSPTIVTPTQSISYVPSPTITYVPSPTPMIFDTKKIYISEVMVYPDSSGKEWVELFNDNANDVHLNNWYIDDVEHGGSAPKGFTITIAAKSFEIIELSSGIFNNDEDHVRLLDNNQQEITRFEYSDSKQGKTWGSNPFEDSTFCMQEPSRNTYNNPCFIINASPTSSILSPVPNSKVAGTIKGVNTTASPAIVSPSPLKKDSKNNQVTPKKNTIALSTKKSGITPTLITKMNTQASNYAVDYKPDQKKEIPSMIFTAVSYTVLGISSIVYKIKQSMPLSLF